MKELIIYTFSDKLEFKANYDFLEDIDNKEKLKYSIIGNELNQKIKIGGKEEVVDFFKVTASEKEDSFTYSEGVYRSYISESKNNIPDKIYIDVLEIYNLQERLKNQKETEQEETEQDIFNDIKHTEDRLLLDFIENAINKNFDFFYVIRNLVENLNSKISNDSKNKVYMPHWKNLLEVFSPDKKTITNFYNNYLKEYHLELKKLEKNIERSDEQLKTDAKIENYNKIVSKYNNGNLEKIVLKNEKVENQEELIIDSFFINNDKQKNNTYLIKKFKKESNVISIFGVNGAEKDIIALNICLESNKEEYYRFFINLDYKNESSELLKIITICFENKPKKKFFIVLNGLQNISQDDFTHYISTLQKISEDKNNVILFTSEDKDFLKYSIIEKSSKFDIKEFKSNRYPSFINNLELMVMYNEVKTEFNEEMKKGDFVFYYIYKLLGKYSYKDENYTKESFIEDLKDCAFKIFNGYTIKVANKDLNFRNQIKKCKHLVSIDNKKGDNLTFNSNMIKAFLVSKYLLCFLEEFGSNKLEQEIKTQNINLNAYKWLDVTNFIAEELLDNYLFNDLLEKYPDFISITLKNLRQVKNNALYNKIIAKINKIETLNPKLLLEISKNYYYDYNYTESVKCGLLAIKNQMDSYEAYNQLASCCLDLFMPEYALYFCEKALEKTKNDLDEARVLGNKARAYLRLGKISEAKRFFENKQSIHEKNQRKIDIIRDKADILLVKAFYDNNNFDNNYNNFEKIITDYDNYDLESYTNQKTNKVYATRNISYFFTSLKNDKDDLIKEFIDSYDKTVLNEDYNYIFMILYINLAKYYKNSGKRIDSNTYLEKASKLLIENKFYAENFLVCAYLSKLSLKNQKDYKSESLVYYDKLKNLVNDVILNLNDSKLFDETFSNNKFIIKNEIEESYLNSLILF